ncbi:MAG TPA: hypothetical protein VF796_14330, partial [Humisphaera sp.]
MADQWTPRASLGENLRYNLFHILPTALQGTFTRRRFWVGLFSRVLRDPGAVRFYQRLRARHASNYVYVRVLATPTLLVMGADGVRRVLERSPEVYGPGADKRAGLAHFQPDAVTISTGRAWYDRRRFNDAVLGPAAGPGHPFAGHFLDVVERDVPAALAAAGGTLDWNAFDRLFARLTRQVILGPAAADDDRLTRQLRQLMRAANRLWGRGRRTKLFDAFYRRLGAYLGSATGRDPTLAGLCAVTPHTDATRVVNQVPHWMFAVWETLSTNAARALALIAAHPHAEARVREELAAQGPLTAAGV